MAKLISLKTLFISAAIMTQLVGCSPAATPPALLQTSAIRADNVARPAAPAGVGAPGAAGGAAANNNTAQAQADTERMVIRNAMLKLLVKNTEEDMSAVTKLAAEMGGFVNSSNTTKFDKGVQATLVLKIPSQKFDAAMTRLRALAIEVQQETITGQDVTAEFSDLDAQTKNLEAAEAQLRGILAKSDKADDVLKVFNELTKIRGQIEQLKGRMNFLSRSAAMATINVTLTPDQLAEPVVLPGWRPQGIAKQAFESLLSALQGLGSLAIWLVIFALPIGLLVFGPPVLLLRWLARRRNRNRAAAKVAAAPLPPTQ